MNDFKFSFVESNLHEIPDILQSHFDYMAFPMDSYLEDMLEACDIFKIVSQEKIIGYVGRQEDIIDFFHVMPSFYQFAPDIFETFIAKFEIKKVEVITQDPLLASLMAEWDYTKEKKACWFIDETRHESPINKLKNPIFRIATLLDKDVILKETGDFFDKLEKQINEDTVYILEENGEMLGCGIIERGRYFRNNASIGMICLKQHRQKGVASTILWHLKEIVYTEGKAPIAGCWFYNILSRKSLEKAGLIAASKGYISTLSGKEIPPLRTGNPPGEDV